MMELRECPFCGKAGWLRGNGSEWWIECTHCEARGEWYNTHGDDAADAWNTRHTPPEVERLVEAVGNLNYYVEMCVRSGFGPPIPSNHEEELIDALAPFQDSPDA